MNEKLLELEGTLKSALDAAEKVAAEISHCPSALALKARVGNALAMVASVKRELETLPKPADKL